MTDALWIVLLVGGSIGMLLLARSMEPHTVSRDGRTFTCRVQSLATDGRSGGGRWVESKAQVVGDRVELSRRGLLPSRRRPQPPRAVLGRASAAPGRFAVFLLQGDEGLLALRVPARSRAVAVLDGLVA